MICQSNSSCEVDGKRKILLPCSACGAMIWYTRRTKRLSFARCPNCESIVYARELKMLRRFKVSYLDEDNQECECTVEAESRGQAKRIFIQKHPGCLWRNVLIGFTIQYDNGDGWAREIAVDAESEKQAKRIFFREHAGEVILDVREN